MHFYIFQASFPDFANLISCAAEPKDGDRAEWFEWFTGGGGGRTWPGSLMSITALIDRKHKNALTKSSHKWSKKEPSRDTKKVYTPVNKKKTNHEISKRTVKSSAVFCLCNSPISRNVPVRSAHLTISRRLLWRPGWRSHEVQQDRSRLDGLNHGVGIPKTSQHESGLSHIAAPFTNQIHRA